MKFLLIVLLAVLFFANVRALNEDTKNYLLKEQWEQFKTKFGCVPFFFCFVVVIFGFVCVFFLSRCGVIGV